MTAPGAKPTPEELGIDVSAQKWERSGLGAGSVEIAFPAAPPAASGTGPGAGSGPAAVTGWSRGDWVLMRVSDDSSGRVLVFDRNEWECFLDGVRNGEFDDAAAG
jgi:hypothetical protein